MERYPVFMTTSTYKEGEAPPVCESNVWSVVEDCPPGQYCGFECVPMSELIVVTPDDYAGRPTVKEQMITLSIGHIIFFVVMGCLFILIKAGFPWRNR